MKKSLLVIIFILILAFFLVSCQEGAVAGQASSVGKKMATVGSQLSFPSVSFDPEKLEYDPKTKKLCYDDAVGKVCESKPMNCKYDTKSKSYSCKLQAKLSYFFPYTNLVFKPLGGKLTLCLPCLITANPTIDTCGDNILDPGEECDDGNQRSRDGCTWDCKRQICGNSIVELPYETCDDGNTDSGDGCSNRCVSECVVPCRECPEGIRTSTGYHCPLVCGNGVLERGEACDGGFSCSSTCTLLEPRTCYACVEGVCGGAITLGDSCGILYDSLDACDTGCAPEPAVIAVPPDASDVDLCEQPDPFSLPEGTRFRDYEDARHISVCEPDDSADCTGSGDCARYLICGRDGTTTVSVEPCPEGISCENGACIDDPRWGGTCFDTDEGADPNTRGAVIFNDGSQETVFFDTCVSSTTIRESICTSEGEAVNIFLSCDEDEYCENVEEVGACILGVPACTDSDGGINAEEVGTTTVTNEEGVILSEVTDFCNFYLTDRIMEFSCQYNDIFRSELLCDAGEHCEGGLCVSGDPFTITCEDTDGGVNIYESGSATTTRSDGRALTLSDFCELGRNSVRELYCGDDGSLNNIILACSDDSHCENGACIEGCSCSRTAATDTTAGYVTGNDCVIQPDICEGDVLHVFRCNAETGLPETTESIVCDSGCTDGQCN